MHSRIGVVGAVLALGLIVASVASAQTSPPASVVTPPSMLIRPGVTQAPTSAVVPPAIPSTPYSGPPGTVSSTYPGTPGPTYPGALGSVNPSAPPLNQIAPVTPTDTDPTGTFAIGGGLSPNAGSLTPLSLTPLAPGVVSATTSPFPAGTTGGLTIPATTTP